MSDSRECTSCHEVKPLTDFGVHSRGPQGRLRKCKDCAALYARKYRARKNAEAPKGNYLKAQETRDSESDIRVCATCGEEKPSEEFISRRGRAEYAIRCWTCRNTPRTPRDHQLWTAYRLRQSDYARMLEEQGGVCAICQKPPRNLLVVDHDHACCPSSRTCGKCVRGLLCDNCNRSLHVVENYGPQVEAYLRKSK